MNHESRAFYYSTLFITLIAFIVILLGAYTRLKDAGLSCPHWPSCHGQFISSKTSMAWIRANHLYPEPLMQQNKEQLEMTHRYFAGSLGLLIFLLFILALIQRRHNPKQPVWIPILLIILVLFQAALGMWTVKWKLYPPVVMGHLLGGMTIVSLLWWLALKTKPYSYALKPPANKLRFWAILGLIIVATQIFLGGWTSANYAGLACPHFPLCYGSLFPKMDFKTAFNFFIPIGQNYDGGFLDITARITIQMFHRYGGFITLIYVSLLSLYLLFNKTIPHFRSLGGFMLITLLAQITLGAINIKKLLPSGNALAHNAVATLLLLTIVTLVYYCYQKE